MGIEKESGTVEKGKRGDLILVNGNPLDDIHNIRNVEYVITNGTMYPHGGAVAERGIQTVIGATALAGRGLLGICIADGTEWLRLLGGAAL